MDFFKYFFIRTVVKWDFLLYFQPLLFWYFLRLATYLDEWKSFGISSSWLSRASKGAAVNDDNFQAFLASIEEKRPNTENQQNSWGWKMTRSTDKSGKTKAD